MCSRYLFVLLLLLAKMPFALVQAQATTPSQGGAVSVISVSSTSMALEFGTTGSGQGRVVTMAASPNGTSVPLIPSDNQFYVGNTTYGRGSALGAGSVVYSGAGYSAVVTGLQPNTIYYITTAEYNVAGASIAYNTRSSSTMVSTSRVSQVPLPVELTSFTGTVDLHSTAVLSWATATERNSAYFALERSADGNTFAEVSRVPAAGNSTQPLSYKWTDAKALRQTTYYRLRQVDLDGAAHFSSVVALAPAAQVAHSVEVYPNPSAGQPVQLLLQSYAGETLTLRLTDVLGNNVLTQTLAPTNALYLAPLPLPTGLAAGNYILTLAGKSSNPIQKRITLSN